MKISLRKQNISMQIKLNVLGSHQLLNNRIKHRAKPLQVRKPATAHRTRTRFSMNMLSPRKRASLSAFRTYASVPASTSSSSVQRTPSQGSRYSYRVQLQPSDLLLADSEPPEAVGAGDSVELWFGRSVVGVPGSTEEGSEADDDDDDDDAVAV